MAGTLAVSPRFAARMRGGGLAEGLRQALQNIPHDLQPTPSCVDCERTEAMRPPLPRIPLSTLKNPKMRTAGSSLKGHEECYSNEALPVVPSSRTQAGYCPDRTLYGVSRATLDDARSGVPNGHEVVDRGRAVPLGIARDRGQRRGGGPNPANDRAFRPRRHHWRELFRAPAPSCALGTRRPANAGLPVLGRPQLPCSLSSGLAGKSGDEEPWRRVFPAGSAGIRGLVGSGFTRRPPTRGRAARAARCGPRAGGCRAGRRAGA